MEPPTVRAHCAPSPFADRFWTRKRRLFWGRHSVSNAHNGEPGDQITDAQISSQMLRSVQMLRSMCVGVSVCVCVCVWVCVVCVCVGVCVCVCVGVCCACLLMPRSVQMPRSMLTPVLRSGRRCSDQCTDA
jgi:hypothetical protein